MSSWYTAISGVNAATANLDTTAHNIANASTNGFKNSRAEFSDMVADGNGIGVQTAAVNQLFAQGSFTQTGNKSGDKVDLAISGNGFFVVRNVVNDVSVDPPIYTRDGSFHLDDKGYLVNHSGQRVQTNFNTPASDIKVDPATLEKIASVDGDGTISFTGATDPIPKGIQLVDFPDQHGLKAIGNTQWTSEAAETGAPVVVASPKIMSGALEASNVDLTAQLVNMIIAQRDFTANAKTITTNDAITQVAVNISR